MMTCDMTSAAPNTDDDNGTDDVISALFGLAPAVRGHHLAADGGRGVGEDAVDAALHRAALGESDSEDPFMDIDQALFVACPFVQPEHAGEPPGNVTASTGLAVAFNKYIVSRHGDLVDEGRLDFIN